MADPTPIPYEDFGGVGPALHFAHANGYPPRAYRPLLEKLAGARRVLAMYLRPMWEGADPRGIHTWRPLADDLARFLDEQGLHGLDGVGHSFGAITTLRLALRQPQRFRRLVLIDPVLFPPQMIFTWEAIYRLGLAYRLHPLVKSALRRRNTFESREAMYANYRKKAVFRRLPDAALQAYAEALACPLPDGRVELCYPAEWEARIYVTGVRADMELWRGLPALKPPLLVIRGAETDTFWESTARLLQRRLPSAEIVTLPEATHLVALEQAQAVAGLVLKFLREQ